MRERETWSVTDIVYSIQFALFWITCVAGVFVTIFTAMKKTAFPMWGVLLVWFSATVIQVVFLVLSAKTDPDPEPAMPGESEKEIVAEVEKELQEIKNFKKATKL